MRALGLCLVAAAIAAAQTPPGPNAGRALVYGVLLERDAQPGSGQFSVRLPDHEVLRYRYDPKTYVVREDTLVRCLAPARGRTASKSSRTASPARRCAMPATSTSSATPRMWPSAPNRPPRRPDMGTLDDLLFSTADRTFSGVVFRITADRLVLHTRDGEQVLDIRRDTRFISGGKAVDAADLKPNTRVFVKAGTGLYGQAQAYQVIWGHILPAQ